MLLSGARCLFVVALLLVGSGSAQECGRRKVNTNNLILHARAAVAGHWPWHACIMHHYQGTFTNVCGGSIIDKNTILTAAHCVLTPSGLMSVDLVSVEVGRIRLRIADQRTRAYEPDRFIVHPEYASNKVQHDIALIKLRTDIEMSDYIQPVCLWNRGPDLAQVERKFGSVIGFGLNENNEVSDYLREADIPVVDFATCLASNRVAFGAVLTSMMYCAGSGNGTSACNGDSGGGMFFEYDGVWYVRGLVSFIPGLNGQAKCDPYQYTVFTDVAKYLDWIQQKHKVQSFAANPVSALVKANPKLSQLNLDICGFNAYPFRSESEKPVFLNYPWVGVLEYAVERTREARTLCHCVLISEWYVLTAAHCVAGVSDKHKLLAVRLGDYDLSSRTDCFDIDDKRRCAPEVKLLPVGKIITHKQYDKATYGNDIALLRLRTKADVSQDNIKPICLPMTPKLRETLPNVYVQAGWFRNSSIMRRTAPTRQNGAKCREQYATEKIFVSSDDRHICAFQKYDLKGRCSFTASAAPLQVIQKIEGSDRYVMHGLLSFGSSKCLSDFPDVYTNVNGYMDWILDSLEGEKEPDDKIFFGDD
uniref:Peptidase S1 domain-containing protein n=1 Tax=Anopheles atroparvus TaxID=41427 RepID=A0A182ISK8_ANOAO